MSLMRRRHRLSAGLALAAAAAGAALAGCGSSQTSSSAAASPGSTSGSTPSASTSSAAASPTSTSGSTPSASTSSAAAPRAAAPGACRPSQLAATYAGTEGASGHLELTLALRNVSSTGCRLRGYPGARLLDAQGHPLPLRVSRGHGFFPDTLPPPRTVIVSPGARAHFGISFPTNNEYAGAHSCRTADAALSAAPGWSAASWLRVSLRRAPRISPCGSRLVVSPVHV